MKYIGLNLSRIKVLWNWTLVYWICAMLCFQESMRHVNS